jgi:CubicO group peptidase (beta-lactamase class C family)
VKGVRRVLATAIALALLASCSSSNAPAAATAPLSITTSTARATTTQPSELTTAAQTVTTADVAADADAAEFTRSLFADLPGDEPGCTVAVGRGGAVVFAEAYGAARLDPFKSMTVDTVVDIASVSKQFTATAILLLAERGAVDLDAPLSTYLPDLATWASRPTVAQLMHHESGIPDYIDLLVERGFDVMGPSPTIADALTALGDVVDLRFVPGTSWEYSNSNYFLLGQIVLAVTGDDLAAFLATEVFEPLGLDMVLDPIAASDDTAMSYRPVDGELQLADSPWEVTGGAGSIHTTPSQLVVWAAQYWEPTIGAPTIDAERFKGAVNTAQGKYGAGIFEADIGGDVGRMLNHNGQWGGFITVFSVAPAHRVAVAVTCTSPVAFGRVRHHRTFDRDLLTSWVGGN